MELLSHRPIRSGTEDTLEYGKIAGAVANLIRDPDATTPLTIAISAPWGVGKTSLANLVEEQLGRHDPSSRMPQPLALWFNAWMHSDAPNLGAAFGASVARDLGRERAMWQKIRRPLATSMLTQRQRIWRELTILGVALVIALAVALAAQGFVEAPDADTTAVAREKWGAFASVFVVGWGVMSLWSRVATSTKAIAKFFDDPSSEASKGAIADVRRRLSGLVEDARRQGPNKPKRRIVIFVDDLERTTPPRAVDVCEVSSQLLNFEGIVTVLIADMPAVAAAAQKKHGSAAGGYRPRDGLGGWAQSDPLSYGRLFLQKLVQLQVDLPPATPERAEAIAFPKDRVSDAPLPGPGLWERTRERLNPMKSEGWLTRRILYAVPVILAPTVIWMLTGSRMWAFAGLVLALVLTTSWFLVSSRPTTDGEDHPWWKVAVPIAVVVVVEAVGVWLLAVALSSESWTWAWWAMLALIAAALVAAAAGYLTRRARNEEGDGGAGRSYAIPWNEVAGPLAGFVFVVVVGVWVLMTADTAEWWWAVALVWVLVPLGGKIVGVTRRFSLERQVVDEVHIAVDEAWGAEQDARSEVGGEDQVGGEDEGKVGYTADDFSRAVEERIEQALGLDLQDASEASTAARSYLDMRSSGLAEGLAKDSSVQRQAEREIRDFVPPIPRSAIRLANQLRFSIYVATKNGLLRHDDETDENLAAAGRVGKWALLSVRWPELAWAIALDPQLIARIESAAKVSQAAFDRIVCAFPEGVVREPGALKRFIEQGAMLGEHALELVYLGSEKHAASRERYLAGLLRDPNDEGQTYVLDEG